MRSIVPFLFAIHCALGAGTCSVLPLCGDWVTQYTMEVLFGAVNGSRCFWGSARVSGQMSQAVLGVGGVFSAHVHSTFSVH
jgi:hypothetical protein